MNMAMQIETSARFSVRRNSMNRKSYPIAMALATFVLAITAAFAQLAGPSNLEIPWETIDGGGQTYTTGGTFALGSTIGQPDANSLVLTGGTLELRGGFWPGADTVITPTCPADIAPSGGNGLVDVDDLLAVINTWGACPGCVSDIAPPGGNGSVDVDDLLLVINSWGVCD
jgi:hypothetical protein